MDIFIKNAYANNLKNISVNITNFAITAFTGVSGSGKSTLLKNVIGAYGAKNLTLISSKTVKNALNICDDVEVENIENLPSTILIDVNSSVSNPASTVSTVSGIHELIRNLFNEFGVGHCKQCSSVIKYNFSDIKELYIDIKIDDIFKKALEFIDKNGKIINIDYYDKNLKPTNADKKKTFATVKFSLNNINEKILLDFNFTYNVRIYAKNTSENITYDVIREIECSSCHTINPSLLRSRFSFNTKYVVGGGACKCCDGIGYIPKIKENLLFQNKSKGILDGASAYVTKKGIKYSAVTEKFLLAVYNKLGIDITSSIDNIPNDKLQKILYGIDEEITFIDRIGGKKTLIFKGLTYYLSESYKNKKAVLSELFENIKCSKCNGTRIDANVSCFKFENKTLSNILNMTLDELGEWCISIKDSVPNKAKLYLDRIINETMNFNKLSCGHLALSRASNTLSGGELQRIRICALLNSNINGLCYLLDEPSSGLHYDDIEKLGKLLHFLCQKGNTIIMVEHNKKLLQYCDYIVDIGPKGGCNGGNVLFSDSIANINLYNTDTAKTLLAANEAAKSFVSEKTCMKDYIEFNNLSYNNLKNVSVKFPPNAYIAVCGISGSGKTTFVRQAVYNTLIKNPEKYNFNGIKYLAQASKIKSSSSTVSTLLKLGTYIANIFEKNSKLKKSNFLPNSSEGKCYTCAGKGYIYSEQNEPIGVCEQCGGTGYKEKVLKVKVGNLNIFELYNTSLEDLKDIIDDKKIKAIIDTACVLGVGYLALSRSAKTLSKGELQRLLLIPIITEKEKKQLIILDEPSKGLHTVDTEKLISSMRKVVSNENTLLVVEHNPELIKNSDYIIEFGGTGINGGYVVYQGTPDKIHDTPTAYMLDGIKNNNKTFRKNNLSQVSINVGGNTIKYKTFNLFYDKNNEKSLLKTAKKTRDDFLAVAIPNNIMFSKVSENNIIADTTLIQTIDFSEKIKYDITIMEATGILSLLKKIVSFNNDKITKYIFDIKSTTGKCSACEGSGELYTVSTDFFFKEGVLTSDCKKFLRNSTDYVPLSKLLKKEKIDIIKKYDELSAKEQQILLWGYSAVYEIEGKPRAWKGLINNFIKQHKYYPDKEADNIFNSKFKILCPVCKGKMLKQNFQIIKCNGLSYTEWMTLPISDILEKISLSNNMLNENKSLMIALKILKKVGMGNFKLSDTLSAIDSIFSERVKFVSLYLNRIYGMGIIIKNIEVLSSDIKETIESIAKECSATNTIWIV